MKHKLLVTTLYALLVLFTHTAQAKSTYLPQFCLDISAIQAAAGSLKVEHAGRSGDLWFGFQVNDFGTSDEWSFIIGMVKANDETEAFNKIVSSLSGLLLTRGPVFDGKFHFTECDYQTIDGLRGLAISPPFTHPLANLSKLSK